MSDGKIGLVRKTVVVLRVVAAHPGGIGLSEVARVSALSKPTCYRILRDLTAEGVLAFDRDRRKYGLGLGALTIVQSLSRPDRQGAYLKAVELLERLAAETRETAGLDVLTGCDVQVLVQAAGPQIIGQTFRPVPRTLPALLTSTGKVLLAFKDDESLVTGAVGDEAVLSAYGDDALAWARRELATVRDQGFATAVDELADGASAIAVPCRVFEEVVCALWVGGPTYRLGTPTLNSFRSQLEDVAKELGGVLALSNGVLSASVVDLK